MRAVRAAFVDRDGVINQLVPDPDTGLPESPLCTEDVALIPGAASALGRLAAAGLRLVGVSNQPAAAKGSVGLEQLGLVQARVEALLADANLHFDAFRICVHHPNGTVPKLTCECDRRKPAPGMLLDAAKQLGIDLGASCMIGETDAHILAGAAAGCRTILIEQPASAHKRTRNAQPDAVASSLDAATGLILDPDRVS